MRYRTRAERGVAAGEFDTHEVILCAPKGYCAAEPRTASFDCSVTYEEIGDYLRQSNSTPRAQYRAQFIASAATRTASLWTRVDDAATSAFWDAAYRMAAQEFPVLEMKERNLTKDSTWIVIRPSDMPTQPKWTYVAFKGYKGHMDLTFSHTALPVFHAVVAQLVPPGMTVHQTGKSTAIRMTVQAFRVSDGLEAAMPKVRSAFEAARRLILFCREHRAELDEAAMRATTVP